MKNINLGSSNLIVPAIGIGCMRLESLNLQEIEYFIQTAMDNNVSFFDHADIYGSGMCEELFAKAISHAKISRDRIIIQSKCGIRQGMFDFSKSYILDSVDKILDRLKTDYLDILLLHRPDALVEPEEVAEAFDELEKSGKVRYFGVSNQNPLQIQLLQKYVKQPLLVNQLQFSITNCNMVSNGINVNMANDSATNRDGSILDYCRLNDITIQTWSPFQYGFFEGTFIDNDKFPKLNSILGEIAEKYSVSKSTIATAWILRHPANMQPIVGTMNCERLLEIFKASDIYLTREEWYQIYRGAGNVLP